jgi:hypothetical protein
MSSQEVTELQHPDKFLEKAHAAEVRQPGMIIDDFDVSRRI